MDSDDVQDGQRREVKSAVAADFRNDSGATVPPVSGVALAADTDNTGGTVEARFGDLWFEARR